MYVASMIETGSGHPGDALPGSSEFNQHFKTYGSSVLIMAYGADQTKELSVLDSDDGSIRISLYN